MMRIAAVLVMLLSPLVADALTLKHVENTTLNISNSAALSSEQKQVLSTLIQRARERCISPADFVVVLEQVNGLPAESSATAQVETVKSFFVSAAVPETSVYMSETSSSGVAKGTVQVQVVCTARG
jgi:hypothetical protein